jgi:hypothetical protein
MRSNYWDCWKGAAISAVVLIHVLAKNSSFYDNDVYAIMLGQVLFTCVPIFLALAGFFCAKKIPSNMKFYVEKGLRLLLPYLVWTSIYIIIFKVGHISNLYLLTKDFAFGEGVGIGYFVILLLQYILVTPFILKIERHYIHFILMVGGCILGIFFLYYMRERFSNSGISKFPLVLIPFFVWYSFYHLGLYAAKHRLHENKLLDKNKSILCILLIFWIFFALKITHDVRMLDIANFPHIQFRITVVITSILLFICSLAYYRKYKYVSVFPLTWLGRNSYAIF